MKVDKFFLILSLSLGSLIGCQTQHKEEVKKMASQQIVRLNNQGDFASLHPHTGIDLMCRNFQKALFEGLTRISPNGSPELAGASAVEISPSKLQYTFTIRPMKWTNGEEVSASHFEKAWKSAISPQSNCLRADLFYPIKNAKKAKQGEVSLNEVGIHALDQKTLVIDLENPTPYFLDLVAHSLFSPLFDQAEVPTVFNGPFRLAQWEHDRKLILEKNPTYWDSETVQLQTIEVSLVNDSLTALLMYEKGELDWIGHPFTTLPQDVLEKVKNSPDFESKPIAGVYWISLNTEAFPLNSVKIRKALSIALNREIIAEHVALGETPSKSLVPTGIALLSPDALYSDANEKKAQMLFEEGLKELNLTHETFPTLHYSYSDIPGQKKLAQAIQQKWEQTFDIQIELSASEWNVFFASLGEKNYQIGGCIWFSVFNDPVYTLDFFKDKSHRYNAAQWENKFYTQLLDLAEREPDPMIRLEHLKQAELLILDEMPIIPLYVVHAKHLKTPRVQSLFVSDLGQVDFKWAYVEEFASNLCQH